MTNFAALEVPAMSFGQNGGGLAAHHTPADNLQFFGPVGLEEGLLEAALILQRVGYETSVTFAHRFPPDLLKETRDYATRWGWGVRPEANVPPRQ
jgi:hypothetical protein